jgi:hypothetical protein
MFKVTFSDGRKIDVAASDENEATRKAYRLDRVFAVVDVEMVA